MTSDRPPFAWREVGLVVAVQAAVLLAMDSRYGPHRDELYFVSAGQRLAWGYPDQPSFTPFLARLATEVAPHHLVVLRLPGILAVVGVVLLAVQYARLLGAGRGGQVLTAVVVAASAVPMALGHRLSTATFDTLAWTAVLVLATQAVVDRRPRLWLAAGVVAGVGLNNKHAVAFLLFGILVACALDRELRPSLRTPWPWLAGRDRRWSCGCPTCVAGRTTAGRSSTCRPTSPTSTAASAAGSPWSARPRSCSAR